MTPSSSASELLVQAGGHRAPDAAPSLSAVVVTHNSAAVIDRCLAGLRATLPAVELIIVDNGSTDETVSRCRRVAGARVLANADNPGFGRGCNQGAAAAESSHLILMNPDVTVVSANLASLLSELDREPLGLVGPMFDEAGDTAPLLLADSAWPVDVLLQALGPLRPRELRALPGVPIRRADRWPAGAMILVSRKEFLRAGGFNPNFFLYYEDRDLARRYRAAGLPFRVTSALVARHTAGRSSADQDSLRIAANGWSYLGWIEYLCEWHGLATARRAVRAVRGLRAATDRILGRLEQTEWLGSRARRKRAQLKGIDAFVSWQVSGAPGSAPSDFYPRARRLIADLGGAA